MNARLRKLLGGAFLFVFVIAWVIATVVLAFVTSWLEHRAEVRAAKPGLPEARIEREKRR